MTDEVKAHLYEDRVGTAAEELVHLQAVMDDFTRTFDRDSRQRNGSVPPPKQEFPSKRFALLKKPCATHSSWRTAA